MCLGGRIYSSSSSTKTTNRCSSQALRQATLWQAGFSIFIFLLLSSEDGFSLEIKEDGRHPAIYNGLFTTIAFLVGGFTSVACGWLGMKIATYANARTALEARKGMAPAFMAGAHMLWPRCSDQRAGLLVLYVVCMRSWRQSHVADRHIFC